MWLQKGGDWLTRLNRPLVAVLKYFAMFTLALMMLLTFADVMLRKLFNSPIPGTAELVQFMMGIVITFSVVYTAYKKSHISVDLLVERFSTKTKRLLACFASLVAFVLFIFVTWQTFSYISDEFHSNLTSPVLYVPVYPFIALSAVAFAILCLVLLSEFLNLVSEVVAKWTR